MQQRFVALIALAGFALLVLVGLASGGKLADSGAERVSFQIATGGSGGTFFAVGQAMAGLISHPPGVGRCETSTVCGPSGLILSTRTSQGALDNLRSVNDGLVDSGFVQANTVAQAIKGTGEFRRFGALKHVRVIASLFAEDMHLVVAANANIHRIADLRGKRVSLGTPGSGSAVTARQILEAYRVPLSSFKNVGDDNPLALMAAGKIDAFFLMAGAPFDSITQLLKTGKAWLVPIDGPELERLVTQVPQLAPATIAAGVYPDTGAVRTVSTRAFWIVRDRTPDALVYGITRALFNPANRAALSQSHPSAREIGVGSAALDPPAPLHPGAARFYREVGALP